MDDGTYPSFDFAGLDEPPFRQGSSLRDEAAKNDHYLPLQRTNEIDNSLAVQQQPGSGSPSAEGFRRISTPGQTGGYQHQNNFAATLSYNSQNHARIPLLNLVGGNWQSDEEGPNAVTEELIHVGPHGESQPACSQYEESLQKYSLSPEFADPDGMIDLTKTVPREDVRTQIESDVNLRVSLNTSTGVLLNHCRFLTTFSKNTSGP